MFPRRLFLIFLLFPLLPTTRAFALKRALLRWAGATIGDNVRICSNVRIYGNGQLTIGENTWIGHETLIICSDRVTIGKNVDVAPRCYIGTGTHVIDTNSPNVAGEGVSSPISIGDGAWLCAGAMILPGSRIGCKNVIAAGAIVKRETPDLEMWGGVPAKKIRSL